MAPITSSLAGALAAASLLLAGCATAQPGTASPAAGTGDQAATAAAAGGGSLIDCSFLTAAEVTALIGSSPAGRAQSGDGGGCTWEDRETYKSVTVEVSGAGSAPGGKLPAWEPALGPERVLPGGMRDINGAVQFVCGGTRWCQVQVVTLDSDKDRDAALGLVDKVRAKVG